MWTEITRRKYERDGLRYASDLSDAEWTLIALHMPPAKALGRPRTTDLRDVMDAILYMASTGCQWAMLPNDFPPPSTVQRYFYDWQASGLPWTINRHLVMEARELEGREAGPSAMPFPGCAMPFPGCAMSLPMAPTRVRNCARPLERSAIGRWKSSNAPIPPRASRSCRAAGSWNGPSPGSDAAVDWPRTGKNQSHPPRHGSSSLISDSSHGDSQDIVIPRRVLSQTLRPRIIDPERDHQPRLRPCPRNL